MSPAPQPPQHARFAPTARDGPSPPAPGKLVNVLGVDYLHTTTEDDGDLYLTAHAEPHSEHLLPRNWFEQSWFHATREQLPGTGCLYALPTKPVGGVSLGLVVKYNRVGTRVPIETDALGGAASCEFNGPFEEFALVHDLRGELRGDRDGRRAAVVQTQLPLAIYVPPERWQPEQLQRFEWRIASKVAQHPRVAIDIMREYILLYSWLPGLDAWQAYQQELLSEEELVFVNQRAEQDLEARGFRVLDMKPAHVILQLEPPGRLARRGGQLRFSVIDYELLERTAAYHQELKARRRAFYQLRRTANGVGGPRQRALRPGQQRTRCLGVDYLHGHAESTGGLLWIVGESPELFDYYLPERWRTTLQGRFLDTHDTYSTTSKDNVRFVWKVSRVGERGEMAAYGPEGFRALAFGFNSPFEEFALATQFAALGVNVITPLAIYRTGHRLELAESRFDASRFVSHRRILALDGTTALDQEHSYITIWEHWSGPDDPEVQGEDRPPTRSLNVRQAAEEGFITDAEADGLVVAKRRRLEAFGVEVIRMIPTHLLVALGPSGAPERDSQGAPLTCLCNFQHLSWPAQVGAELVGSEEQEGEDDAS